MSRSEAEKLIRRLAADSINVAMTNHANERMRQRDISITEVFRTLRQGGLYSDPVRAKRKGEWKCKVVWPADHGRDIGVVTVIVERKKLIILTVEWEDLI
jgi:hypothetical protein